MTRMTRPDCVVMFNLINTHTHTHTHIHTHTRTANCAKTAYCISNLYYTTVMTPAAQTTSCWNLAPTPGGDSDVARSVEGAIPRPSLHSKGESREQANHTSVSEWA